MVFNETFLRLEDSFARLRRFTADASHELRTPLTAIRSVGEVGMHEGMDAASCREVIGSMLEETDRLTKLVDSLLTLSRADAGTVPFSKEVIDLAALAVEVGECLQVLAEEKEQNLAVAAPAPVFAEVDRSTLRQALINLLDNAIKYTPVRGEVQVTVGTTPGGEAALAVIDNGPGIAAEHREKIFERFYRVDEGRSREVGGRASASPSPNGPWRATAAGSNWIANRVREARSASSFPKERRICPLREGGKTFPGTCK